MQQELPFYRSKTFHRKKIMVMFTAVFLALLFLMGRLVYLMVFCSEYYGQKAQNLHERERDIKAARGKILDANGMVLATNKSVCTISVIHSQIEDEEAVIKALVKELGLSEEAVRKRVEKVSSIERVKTNVPKETGDKIRAYKLAGIKVDEDYKRYYPYDTLASKVLGFTGGDNQGIVGLEVKYDSYLQGTNGKILTLTDARGIEIENAGETRLEPVNGYDLNISMDYNIQLYCEQAAEKTYIKKDAKYVSVIVMNPSNGEIFAMVNYPEFHLNDPFTLTEEVNVPAEKKQDLLNQMWRNQCISDTYEPGSTFKIIAASIGLEEKIVETDTAGDFYCGGSETVSGTRISCANRSGHGSQSLRNALENSCNPALIQLGQRIGVSTFYKYLDAFGFFEKTGIDLPSEGTSSFWKEKNVGPVELATMSFGQRFTITPMQLVKAAAAIANEGKLVTPHVVKEIENPDTGTVKTIQTNEERQVISEDTANKIKDMMKSVVETGGGKYAQVKGYEIGGKTGTSEADPNHPENGYVASFLAIAPVDNTKIVLLLTLYAPKVRNYYGGSIAAPAVSQMLSEILPYLDIPSNNSDEGNVELVSVPNVTNKTIAEAQKILKAAGLEYSSVGDADNIVSEQVPKSGTQLQKNGIVKIYAEGKDERVSQTVPDLKGVSLAQAKVMLKARNLNISSKGTGIVIAQDPKAGTSVDEGTVINVTLQEATTSGQH